MFNAVSLHSHNLPTIPYKQELSHAASLSAVTITTLASIALAYYNPNKWIQITALTATVQIVTLPSLIKKARTDWIKPLLIISMVGISCLLTGGAITSIFKRSEFLYKAFRAARHKDTIIAFMQVSGLVGYGLPACQMIFKKMNELAQSSNWNDKLRHLKTDLDQTFVNRTGYVRQTLQSSLMLATLASSNILQLALISLCLLLRIDIVPSLLMMEASSTSQGIDRLKEIIYSLKFLQNAANFFSIPIADNVKETFHNKIKQSLLQIDNERDLQQAFTILENDIIPIITSFETQERLVDLLQGEFLIFVNGKIEAFIQDIESNTGAKNQLFLNYEQFEQELLTFEQACANRPLRQDLLTTKDQLLTKLSQLKTNSDALVKSKRFWQSFFDCLQFNEEAALHRLTNPQRLTHFIEEHDPDFQRIRAIHQSLIGELSQRFQRCTNLLTYEEEAEEAISACLFLGAERCDFKTGDYQDLQRWLNVDSLPEIEDKLNAIGLQTEEDLYANNILPRREFINKQTIKTNLKSYIEEQLKIEKKWSVRLYKSFSQLKQTTPSLKAVVEKIIQFTYTIYLKGLILVPVLLHPQAAVIGCAIPPLVAVARLIPFLARLSPNEDIRVLSPIANLLGRLNLITITSLEYPRTAFENGNLITRIRLVYWMTAITVLLNSPIGSFLEGIKIGKSVVSRLTQRN